MSHHRSTAHTFFASLTWLLMGVLFAITANADSSSGDLPFIEGFTGYTEHGRYSETYESDWSTLNSGPAFAPGPPVEGWVDVELPELDWTTVTEIDTSEGRQELPLWHNGGEDYDVHITAEDIPPLRVKWTADRNTYDTTVIRIQNKRDVVIEGIAIEQLGHVDLEDYTPLDEDPDGDGNDTLNRLLRTGKHSIFVDGCRSLVIRDVYLAGPVAHSHIRVEGCQNVLIERVHVRGLPVEVLLAEEGRAGLGDGFIGGTGIGVFNGKSKDAIAEAHGVVDCSLGIDYVNPSYLVRDCSENPEGCFAGDLEWIVIQNNYIHDYTLDPDESAGDHDGISMASPADGIIFNNYVADWWAGDNPIDVGHRRACDDGYRNHRFRIERNIFVSDPNELSQIKTPGVDSNEDATNAIIMANNFYSNVRVYDDHEFYSIDHINESFFVSGDWGGDKQLYKMYGNGPTHLENQFVRSQGGEQSLTLFKSHNLPFDPSEWGGLMELRSNLYAGDSDIRIAALDDDWTKDSGEATEYRRIDDFGEWQGYGVDEGSLLTTECDSLRSSARMCGAEDHGINVSPGRHIAFRVNQDFFGARRGRRPTAGALEASSWNEIRRPMSPIRSGVAGMLRRGTLIGD